MALTVDHGLNAESAAWTQRAGAAAERVGVAWRALAWCGDKPATGLPARAREARHRLLAEAARKLGARVLLFGHTADDVRESELIRGETPGHGRLRAWAPSPVWPQGRGVFLLRPLLDLGRAELRAWLGAQGMDWLEDPANTDLRYARSRARVQLARRPAPHPPSVGGELDGVDADAQHLARRVELTPGGGLALTRVDAAAMDGATLRRLFGVALLCASGGERPVRGGALDRLVDRARRGAPFVVTGAGARVVLDEARLACLREGGERRRGGLAPPALASLALARGETAVFDGRFEVAAPQRDCVVDVVAGHMAQLSEADRAALRRLRPEERPCVPVVLGLGERPRLPVPFGSGPIAETGLVQALAGARFAAACGLITDERDLTRPHGAAASLTLSSASVCRLAGGRGMHRSNSHLTGS